jgi:SNF2 family DNA or RNA helicase
LRERFKKLRVGEARGNITDTAKRKYLEAWHQNKVDVFVANPASLGVGVDLYEARIAVYYSNGFRLIDRKQSEKRTHRTGQKRHCLYIDLVCSGTVDEYILSTLEKSQDAFTGLTKDQVRDAVRQVSTLTPGQGKLP